MVGVLRGVPLGLHQRPGEPVRRTSWSAARWISRSAPWAVSRRIGRWLHVWLPRSWPASTTAPARAGFSCSQVPTARTVIPAPAEAASARTRRHRAASPAPWKVSATAGTDRGPCRRSPRAAVGTAEVPEREVAAPEAGAGGGAAGALVGAGGRAPSEAGGRAPSEAAEHAPAEAVAARPARKTRRLVLTVTPATRRVPALGR